MTEGRERNSRQCANSAMGSDVATRLHFVRDGCRVTTQGNSTPEAQYSSHQPLRLTGEINYHPRTGLPVPDVWVKAISP
jgi:hypothetical protein